MKHIVFLAVALLLAGCAGRGGHNHAADGHEHEHEVHPDSHVGHDHGHSADHTDYDNSTIGYAGHDHSHDHSDGHTGHDHFHSHDHYHAGDLHTCQGPFAGADGHTDDPEEIIFTRAQARQAGVEVETVEKGSFSEVLRVTGVISPAQGDRINIVAPASGIVSFRGGGLTEGSRVGSGTALFTVASDRVSGGDELARNQAAYTKAKADLERAERLRADNIVSQAELDAALAEYEAARTAYESLSGSAGGRGASVTSPIGGYVYGISVTGGDYVETGTLLATVVRERDMELRAEVPQRMYARLAGVTDANFRPQGSDAVYNVAELGGRLVSKGVGVSPGTPFIPVTFRFGYVGGIPAGSYADVDLLGAGREGVITLPTGAVTEQQGLYYVYVHTGGDVYRRREVSTGGNDGRRIEITDGLAEGETVVVRGAVNIRMAAASGAIPHGHEH